MIDKSRAGQLSLIMMATLIILLAASNSFAFSDNVISDNTAVVNSIASSNTSVPENLPSSLSEAGERGENVYDFAKVNDWKNVNQSLKALIASIKQIPSDIKKQRMAKTLDKILVKLGRDITAKNRFNVMREANEITLKIAEMTTTYKLSFPIEVTKLDYYGREIELWAEINDTNKLQATARQIRQQWNNLRAAVEARSIVEAKNFEALVKHVEAAKTTADYARLAKPMLDEVDELEKIFQ